MLVESPKFVETGIKLRLMSPVIVCLLLVCGCFNVVFAESPDDPALIQISTPIYKNLAGPEDLPLGLYQFEVSWQGIPAAELSLRVARSGEHFNVVASAKTFRAIDLFYKLRYRAEGLFLAENFSPLQTVINQVENSKERFTEITYLENGEVRAFRQRKGKDPEQVQFNPNNFMLEPFSAAFVARSLDWSLGETRYIDAFNGKSRYLISLTAVDLVSRRVGGEMRQAWVIVPRVKNISSKDSDSKLREARIYLSADSRREVFEIESEVFIGSVRTVMTGFTPDWQLPPERTQVARNSDFSQEFLRKLAS